jgi:hypothetical protein
MCSMHWQRWKRHGNPLIVLPPSAGPQVPAEIRFWAKVDKTSTPDGCWEWTAARDRDGYGAFKVDGRMWRAPRWIFTQINGPMPDHEMTRHTCDNPPCVRPDHLVRGTVVQNAADQIERDRTTRGDRHHTRRDPGTRRRGEANGAARLTEEQVLTIRARYSEGATQVALAQEFNVSQPLVSQIIRRVAWSHIE